MSRRPITAGLPGEVVSVIDEGYARECWLDDDPYVTDTRSEAARRVAADRADMDTLLADAREVPVSAR